MHVANMFHKIIS